MEVRGPDQIGVVTMDNIQCYNCGNRVHIARDYQKECNHKADQLALLWVLVGQQSVVKTFYANGVEKLLQKLVQFSGTS